MSTFPAVAQVCHIFVTIQSGVHEKGKDDGNISTMLKNQGAGSGVPGLYTTT